MKIVSKIRMMLLIILCSNAAYSSIPNTDHPTTFLGPMLRGTFTTNINNETAYAITGEAGPKNFRLGGTFGLQIVPNQRIKATAEYLWQQITYPFFSGDTNRWEQQGALGGSYQYIFPCTFWDPALSLSAYYSHSNSRTLNMTEGIFTNHLGVTASYLDDKRIAGADVSGIAPGITVHPWLGGFFGFDLNYDHVLYNKNTFPSQNASGFGATVNIGNFLAENLLLNLSGAIRQSYDHYTASLDVINLPFHGLWGFSLGAAFTAGRHTLPSTWNLGLSVNYFLDRRCETACASPLSTGFINLSNDYETTPATPIDFLHWTAEPAVYMPQILAIPDERVIVPAP